MVAGVVSTVPSFTVVVSPIVESSGFTSLYCVTVYACPLLYSVAVVIALWMSPLTAWSKVLIGSGMKPVPVIGLVTVIGGATVVVL